MKLFIRIRALAMFRWMLLLVIFVVPQLSKAQWQAAVGAQSHDKGSQILAFLPNEIWIHAGDNITWSFVSDEVHTVTFLTPGQVRPSRFAGCPGTTPDFSVFDGTVCVNSGVLQGGTTYTVAFPLTGNFKLVCLAHPDMTATIHVLAGTTPLPHDQAFYDQQAASQRASLLSDARASAHVHSNRNAVVAGAGKITSWLNA